MNNYQYVPNPTGWVDPLGLHDIPCKEPCKEPSEEQAPEPKADDVENRESEVTKSVPSKFTKPGGGSDAGDFITDHSQKHMFDPSVASTKSRSQFGQDINVKALRDDTMTNPTSAFSDINSRVTKYSKSYDFNISTPATPTGEMRVFINNAKPNRSSQFPYVPRKKD